MNYAEQWRIRRSEKCRHLCRRQRYVALAPRSAADFNQPPGPIPGAGEGAPARRVTLPSTFVFLVVGDRTANLETVDSDTGNITYFSDGREWNRTRGVSWCSQPDMRLGTVGGVTEWARIAMLTPSSPERDHHQRGGRA